MLNIPTDECIKAFESYYKTPIPASLLVVGNNNARKQLEENIKNAVATLLVGPNGSGKDIAIRKIAEKLGLEIRKSIPLNQASLALSFGKGPLYNNNNFLYVVDIDSFPKKTYSVLLRYVTGSKSPIVLITNSKNNAYSKIVKACKIITLSHPSPNDIEKFLNEKYNWYGNIADIYDEDMRVVINRAVSGSSIGKIKAEEIIGSAQMAMNISCGFAKIGDFNRVKDPLWWIIRWLSYNQRKKLPDKTRRLENLNKLSEIDSLKFRWNDTYLKYMLLDMHSSPVRSRFSFPLWPKKKDIVEEQTVEKFKRADIVKKKVEQTDFSKWL